MSEWVCEITKKDKETQKKTVGFEEGGCHLSFLLLFFFVCFVCTHAGIKLLTWEGQTHKTFLIQGGSHENTVAKQLGNMDPSLS